MTYAIKDSTGRVVYRGQQLAAARRHFEALPDADFEAGVYVIAKREGGRRVRMLAVRTGGQ